MSKGPWSEAAKARHSKRMSTVFAENRDTLTLKDERELREQARENVREDLSLLRGMASRRAAPERGVRVRFLALAEFEFVEALIARLATIA